MEEWRDVVGYEGKYKVSNFGRVKSLNYRHTGKEGIMKSTPDKDEYERIGLYKNGKREMFGVHRLVAEAFIPNPDNLPQVNHKDENPSNNHVDNLEWCTCEYNNNYGTKGKRISEANKGKFVGHKHSRSKKVKCITTGEIFGSISEAERKYNTSHTHISDCCKGKYKSAGKHPVTGEKLVWEYI